MTTEPSDAILEFLEAILCDDLTRLPDGADPVSVAVARIIQQRRTERLAQLDGVVERTILSNELGTSGAGVSVSSDSFGVSAQSVAATSDELAASVSSINSALERSREQSKTMRGAAEQSSEATRSAVDATYRTNEALEVVTAQSEALMRAAEGIDSAIRTIDGIAIQTRLLALNASVEAARAGDAGRGFAIVAQEVRSLSEGTKTATDAISEMVGGLRETVAAIVGSVERADLAAEDGRRNLDLLGGAMSGLVGSIVTVDDDLGSISEAVSEQAIATSDLANTAMRLSALAESNLDRVRSVNGAIDKLVAAAGRELADAAKVQVANKVPRLAKADHVIWKKRLADMFAGRLQLKADELSDHRCCRLGKWYYGDGSAHFQGSQAFQALEAPHKRVHEAGIRAASLYNAGKREEALECMEQIAESSAEVLGYLDRLLTEHEPAKAQTKAA